MAAPRAPRAPATAARDPRTLSVTFPFALTAAEHDEIVALIDGWAGSRVAVRTGYQHQHQRHVEPDELATHYPAPHCDWSDPEAPACDRAQHEPLFCRDCGHGIVSAPGLRRQLVCSRLNFPGPLRLEPCHANCVVECGEPR